MFIKPSDDTTQSLAAKISEVKERKGSCLDEPKFSAQHLRTKEELEMFYQESQEAEVTVVVAVTYQAVVAVGTMMAATLLAVNGPNAHLSKELDNLAFEEVDNLNVNDLLNARCKELI